MRYLCGIGTVLAAALVTASAQSNQARLSFEAATVKVADPAIGGGRAAASGDRIVLNRTTLLNALARAFGLTFPGQIIGPSWVFNDRYDIVAKAPDNTPKSQIPLMLQTLLEERFKLVLHHETRELPAYALTTGKGRLKLQEVKDASIKNSWAVDGDSREARSMSMGALSAFLSPMLRAPVLDMTGLEGYYNFPLVPTMEETSRDSLPSVFTVIEGLGLKLVSRKAPLDVVVIDSGNKVPTEN
jgi:uncharacterized protein (TIGR03435 family)